MRSTIGEPREARPRRWRRLLVGVAVVSGLCLQGVSVAPQVDATTVLKLVGHGYGHGRGLGQWGSYGYAVNHGWSAAQILDHYYGGTTAGSRANETISVQLRAWTGKRMAVTSGAPFQVGNFGTVGAGSLAEIYEADGSWWMRTWYDGCNRDTTFAGYGPYAIGVPTVTPSAPGDSMSSMLTLCGTERRTYRGDLRVAKVSGTTNVVNNVPMESYLRGVVPRESPASWGSAGGTDPATGKPRGFQALAAQAVAARSYAFAENRSPGNWKTCDTIACQVYGGAFLDGVSIEDSRTDQAIAATAGVVRVRAGATVRTEFSASTGGWTAGGDFPAVVDVGDEVSPYHDWNASISASQIQAKYPTIGTFTGIRVTKRNGLGDMGGRVLEMEVIGTAGTQAVSGSAFQSAFGLRSNWFALQEPTQLTWRLRQTPTAGASQVEVPFGAPGDRALACDFDGDGSDGVTVYQGNTFYGRHSTTAGAPQVTATYGDKSYVPVCGDWDGDSKDGIGVFVGGVWYLRNTPTPGPPEVIVPYGYSGVTPVVGDWNGDGVDGIGVFDGGRWYLRETASQGAPQTSVSYGVAGYIPVIADWDGVPGDGIGVYVGGQWYLRQSPSPGPPQITVNYGTAGYSPVPGDWDGVGGAGVGVTLAE